MRVPDFFFFFFSSLFFFSFVNTNRYCTFQFDNLFGLSRRLHFVVYLLESQPYWYRVLDFFVFLLDSFMIRRSLLVFNYFDLFLTHFDFYF